MSGPARKRVLVRLLAVLIAVVAIVVLGHRPTPVDIRRAPWCDDAYVALNGEIANELDRVLRGDATACGTTGGPRAVVECVLRTHAAEQNPRNRAQRAYTTASEMSENATSCQVGLAPYSTNGVRVQQYPRLESATSRTFSIVIGDR